MKNFRNISLKKVNFYTKKVFKLMGRSVMYIQTDYYNLNMRGAKNDVNFWKKMRQKLLDCIPEKTLEDNARNVTKWKKYNDSISNPATNRLIMGVTALATQPAIDYHNHKVDKETREISTIRTISKIIAKDDYIVGAHIVSKEASALIQQVLIAIQNKISLEDLKDVCFAHPTFSEGIFEAICRL